MKNIDYLEYSSKLNLIETSLKSLKSAGADVTVFEEELNNIKTFVNDEVKNVKNSVDVPTSLRDERISQIYFDAKESFKILVIKLNQYSLYFQAYNRCSAIYNAQNQYDVDNENLSSIIDELIETLNLIKSMTIIDENNSLESLYNIIYDVIKTEYRLNGTSKLLSYCKQDNVDSGYISRLVMEDIETLKYKSESYGDIEKKLSKLNFADGERMYLDDNLIWLISIGGDKEKYAKHLSEYINNLTLELRDNNNSGMNISYNLEHLEYKLERSKERAVELKKKYKMTKFFCVFPLVLTLTQIGLNTGFVVDYAISPVYMTTTETYSSENGETVVESKYDDRLQDSNNNDVDGVVKLTVYEPWKNKSNSKYIRLVETAEIPVEEFEKLKDLTTINVDDLNYSFTTDEEKISSLATNEIYEQPKFVATKETQDVSSEKTRIASGDSDQLGLISLKAFVYILCYLGQILFITNVVKGTYGIINSIKLIKRTLKEIKDSGDVDEETNRLTEEIEGIVKYIEELIDKNNKNYGKYNEIAMTEDNRALLAKCSEGINAVNKYMHERDRSEILELKIDR